MFQLMLVFAFGKIAGLIPCCHNEVCDVIGDLTYFMWGNVIRELEIVDDPLLYMVL